MGFIPENGNENWVDCQNHSAENENYDCIGNESPRMEMVQSRMKLKWIMFVDDDNENR